MQTILALCSLAADYVGDIRESEPAAAAAASIEKGGDAVRCNGKHCRTCNINQMIHKSLRSRYMMQDFSKVHDVGS